jgi:ribosome-binding protein aMBF1 (putative translation factor)
MLTSPSPYQERLCGLRAFTGNTSYPQNIQFLGDKIRATRMENFMSTELLVKKIGINESTIVNWELKDIKPSSGLLKRIEVFFASHGSEPSG